jgi:hypothetical protein
MQFLVLAIEVPGLLLAIECETGSIETLPAQFRASCTSCLGIKSFMNGSTSKIAQVS